MLTTTNFQRFIRETPVLFPLIALFHLFLLIRSFVDFSDTFVANLPTIGWYALACVLSVFCMFQIRLAAIGYIVLTVLGLLLQFALPVDRFWKDVGSTLFPFDVLMCFFLLFYYKRLR